MLHRSNLVHDANLDDVHQFSEALQYYSASYNYTEDLREVLQNLRIQIR